MAELVNRFGDVPTALHSIAAAASQQTVEIEKASKKVTDFTEAFQECSSSSTS